jgi:GAF domain-containing protein
MTEAVHSGLAASRKGDDAALAIPLLLRGRVIGVIDGRKRDGTMWTSNERDLLQALAGQLSVALEGAQLYRDAQRRAAREQMTREITDSMRGAIDMDELLQTVLSETAGALGASRAFVQWMPESDQRDR